MKKKTAFIYLNSVAAGKHLLAFILLNWLILRQQENSKESGV